MEGDNNAKQFGKDLAGLRKKMKQTTTQLLTTQIVAKQAKHTTYSANSLCPVPLTTANKSLSFSRDDPLKNSSASSLPDNENEYVPVYGATK